MELRHPRLREAEHRAGLLHRDALVVVEGDYRLLLLRQGAYRVRHEIDALARQQCMHRIAAVALEQLLDLQPLLTPAEPEILEAEEAHLADFGEQGVQL